MENNNELLRMISQALQNNHEVNNEIVRLVKKTTIPPSVFNEVMRLLKISKSTLDLIREATPTE